MPLMDIRRIRIESGLQHRARKNAEAIEEYRDAYIEGVKLPPVELIFDGTDYWLWDGFHRLDSATAAGRKGIEVNIRRGTRREAFWLSVGANQGHGLRRTNDDKRNAVKAVLQDQEGSALSNREIAERCGVSHALVNILRGGPSSASVSTDIVEGVSTSSASTTAKDGAKPSAKSEESKTAPTGGMSENGQSGPVTTTKPGVKTLGSVEVVIAERDAAIEQRDRLAELAKELQAELATSELARELGSVEEALRADNAKLREQLREQEAKYDGVVAEKADAVRLLNWWKKRAKQAGVDEPRASNGNARAAR